MVTFEIVTGIHWRPFIRAYLPPTNIDHLPDIGEALNGLLGIYTIIVRT